MLSHPTWSLVYIGPLVRSLILILFVDAEELLTKNCESAEKNLAQIAFDLDYLRDQMTITEVTMARLYNWDVKRRKEKKTSA